MRPTLPWIGGTLVGLGTLSVVGAVLGYRLARARGSGTSGASEAAARIMAGLIAIVASLLLIILIADACRTALGTLVAPAIPLAAHRAFRGLRAPGLVRSR